MSFRGASNVAGLFADTSPSERMTRSLLAVPGRSFNGRPDGRAVRGEHKAVQPPHHHGIGQGGHDLRSHPQRVWR